MKMKLIFIFLIILSFAGCKIGTDTGNPVQNPQAGQGENPDCGNGRCAYPMETSLLRAHICSKIQTCFNLENSSCVDSVGEIQGLNQFLTLPYQSWNELDHAYAQKKIAPNQPALNFCHMKIEELSCDTDLIKSTYNPETSEYLGVHNILLVDESCKYSFIEKE